MAKTQFTKVALTADQLLAKLVAQGLIVPAASQATALTYFQYIGAFRLKGYWYKVVDPATKQFPPGYTVQQLIDLAEFDRGLRSCSAKAIEVLELAIRSVISNAMSVAHNPHWFLERKIFKPTNNWGLGQLIKKIEDEVGRSQDKKYIQSYFQNHDDPYLPPSWAITECVTFGLWSRTYQIFRDSADRKKISMKFNIDNPDVFQSWLHAITVLRNTVAHHSQILGVKLRVSPSNYKAHSIKFSDNQSFYALATVMNHLGAQTQMPMTLKADLQQLFNLYPQISPNSVGFPPNWAAQAGW